MTRDVREPDEVSLRRAADAVGLHLEPTPVVASPGLGRDVLLKLETLQPTGSFKVRGALAAVAATAAGDGGAPLVAASAGNHALGLAYAARLAGAHATVVVPRTASPAKVAALERSGARLVRHGAGYDEAEAHALEMAASAGARFVSPYNDPDVIAGAATLGRELLDQAPGLSTVVVPVGGGGLLSGIGLGIAGSAAALAGVEAERSTAMSAALSSGRAVPVDVGETLADGLAGNLEPGSVTIGLASRFVSEMVTVGEEEIAEAIRFLAAEHGLVVEGSGAVGVAALLAGRLRLNPGTSAVVVTGRNISISRFAGIVAGQRSR